MSIAHLRPPSATSPAIDEFRYGYRWVVSERADGTKDCAQVPLTLDDVLHPQFGDVIMQSDQHQTLCAYLASVFRSRLANDPTALAICDVGVFWDDPEFRQVCPDVAIFVGLKHPKPMWQRTVFDCAEEGGRPNTIIELVSPNHRDNDVVKKLGLYHQLKIPMYVICDLQSEDDDWELVGYQYTPKKYLPVAKDERGRIWIPTGQVWIGAQGKQIVLWDGATDAEIPDYQQMTTDFKEMESNLAEETSRAEKEKARADSERTRAESERTRAEMEHEQANRERERAELAEAKLRELEARLKNQGG